MPVWMGGAGLAAGLLCLLVASVVGAQEFDLGKGLDRVLERGDMELAADFLEYERSRGLYTASGNVVLKQGSRTIRADWVSFNQLTGVGVASGNVVVEEEGNVIRSSFIEFDVYGVRGVVRDGSFDSSANQFRARGKVIEKTGRDTYAFREAVFTTCRCPDEDAPEPWRVTAEEAEIEVEGYAVVKNSTLEVLGIPMFWLPWMIYPVKTKRQSGLLLPDVEWSDRVGVAVEQPLFLAPHDQLNVTLTPGFSSKRGGRGRFEAEWVFGEESSGDLLGVYTRDQSIETGPKRVDGERTRFSTPFDRNRYAVQSDQDVFLPGGLRLRANADAVSDNQVPLDLKEARGRRAARRLSSTGWLGGSFGAGGRLAALADARLSDDMQNPDDRDRDDTVLQRLPGGRAALLPGASPWLPRLVSSLDVDYAYFAPRADRSNEFANSLGPSADFLDVGIDGVPDRLERAKDEPLDPLGNRMDPTEGDGRFQEGELLIDEGHRVVVHPRLATPFQAGPFLEVYPEVGWHQTLYDTDVHGFDQRGFFTGRLDARSRLRGRLGSYTHIIEPTAGYALALVDREGRNPRFVPRTATPQQRLRALELDSLTRDDADRLSRVHVATLGVTNRLIAENGRHGIDFSVLALHDFVTGHTNQLIVDANVRSSWGLRGRLQMGFDPAAAELDESLVGVGWRHQSGLDATLRYRFVRDIPETFEAFPFGNRWDDAEDVEQVHQIRAEVRIPLTRQWLAGYRGAYSLERNELLTSAASLEYLSRCNCWSAGLEFSGDIVSGIGVRVLYSIQGFGFSDLPADRRGVLDAR